MECACTVGTETDITDKVQLLENRFVKSRKVHSCDECRRIIAKGDEYYKETWVYDGKVNHHKTCEDCYSLRQVFFSSGGWYGQLIDDMSDFVVDCGGELSVPCLLELTPRARGMVCDMVEKTWDEEV